MSSKRRLSHNGQNSANKLKLDSLSKVLKIDSSKRRQIRDSIVKEVTKGVQSEFLRNPSSSSRRYAPPDFKTFLSQEDNIKVFREFLQSQYCSENLNFYIACKKYQKLNQNLVGSEMVKFMAAQIYNDFLSQNSRQPINVDNSISEMIKVNLKNPQPDLFSQAQAEIFDLMRTDCYPRFCKTYAVIHDKPHKRVSRGAAPDQRGA